tara:strand:- start:55 stop:249 length:195 start_codon:yes stop_codon:yes gene_type:complete
MRSSIEIHPDNFTSTLAIPQVDHPILRILLFRSIKGYSRSKNYIANYIEDFPISKKISDTWLMD